MSEIAVNGKEFLEVGDQLVVKIEGLPVAYATIVSFGPTGAVVEFDRKQANLPMAVFDYEVVDND